MWGASNHIGSSARSPATTPTSNGLYPGADSGHMKLSNQILSPSEHAHHAAAAAAAAAAQSNAHLKWSESQAITSKDIPVSAGIYSIHSHQSDTVTVSDASSMYAQVAHSPHLTHHTTTAAIPTSAGSAGHIVSPDHNSNTTTSHHSHPANALQPPPSAAAQQSIGSSCEVWSPAYSQYQYFTYHHAPQHANTQ